MTGVARRPVAERLRRWLIARCAPISIDGQTVQSITIDGEDVTEVTMDGDRVFSDGVPDSVVLRDADSGAGSVSDKRGLKFSNDAEWPDIQGRISSQTANATSAYLTETDGTVISSVDISSLTSNDVFTFTDVGLASGIYYMLLDADGSSYDAGTDNDPSFPYTSSDGELSIDAGVFGGTSETTGNANCILEIGNINL